MKPRARMFTGLVVGSALALGAALPAAAGTGAAETEGWAMEMSVGDYTWTDPDPGCEYVPVEVVTDGWGAKTWTVVADVRHATTGAPAHFDYVDYAYLNQGDPDTVDDYLWESALTVCSDDAAGSYVVEGTASYGYAGDYGVGSAPGQQSAPIATSFTLSKMGSSTTLNPVKSDGKTAVVSGKVVGKSPEYGALAVEKGSVSVQRQVNGAWQTVGTTTTNASGAFSVPVSGATAAVPYRAVYAGSSKVAASTSPTVTASVPKPATKPVTKPKPKPAVSTKAVSKKGKLKVDVNPNKGKGYWTFQVQKKVGDTWVPQKTYKTSGSKETKTVNLPKGTYRVKVNGKYGYASTHSAPVTLVK